MDTELRSMIMAYRVPELQKLLAFVGKDKTGRKYELQARALELVKLDTDNQMSLAIVMKIKELYKSVQLSKQGQLHELNPVTMGATAGALAGTRSPSGHQYVSYSTPLMVNHQDPVSNSTFGRNVGYQRVIGMDGQLRTVPICPDVKMKELPFYDILAVLLRPTSLINQGPSSEVEHSFCLSPSQAGEIASSRQVVQVNNLSENQYFVQVQLRFCAVDPSTEQDDLFPPGLVVKVNGQLVPLPPLIPSNRPGVESKRPSKPLNITTFVKVCPLTTNTIGVQWIEDFKRNYCMQVNLVKKLTAEVLFGRLKQKGIQPADFTRGRIKELTSAVEEEDLCAPSSIPVTVACPLGKMRMTWPCRATTCKHLQCFDAKLFLLMNEMKPSFVCPVCNQRLKFGDLCIDGYFMDVINSLSIEDDNKIELFADGSWKKAVKRKMEAEDVEATRIMKPVATKGINGTIDLDDDDEIVILDDEEEKDQTSEAAAGAISSNSKPQQSEPEIIDLSSDDEEESSRAVLNWYYRRQ